MINIQIAKDFTSLEDLDAEINCRQDLRDQMVGRLYPSVLQDEISVLVKQKEKIEKIIKKNLDYAKRYYN